VEVRAKPRRIPLQPIAGSGFGVFYI